ncbi:MAG: hypothetical protein IT160_05655 [Bryobacterales bacterium]|nr:hypothetical protein [Bryobacterales bacterium]
MRGVVSFLLALSTLGYAQDNGLAARARQLESDGDGAAALALLKAAVENAPEDRAALEAYAGFLDTHRDPGARDAYEKLLGALAGPGESKHKVAIARRLVILDLLANDRTAAVRHLEEYRHAGGRALTPPAAVDKRSSEVETRPAIEIPGPLHSFARMAALAPDLRPDDILPALARNIVTNGYQAVSGNEALDQTEYLKLVVRYLSQARELQKLAGAGKTIHIASCESTQTADLLRVLGYRMRGACGSDLVLETVNATRAFLTIDSGFPLTQLEQALRTNRPFLYDFKPSKVPVLFGPEYWMAARDKQTGEFIDAFIADPSLCRLYIGMSRLDPETAEALRKEVPVQKIKIFAHVLDFFGIMFEVRDGKAVVPGGAASAQAWSEMVGVSPDKGAAFFERLIARDDGWLAGYFDALARINGPVSEYLTQPARMKRVYLALRGKITSPGPARPVFRANTDLMLLTTRLRLDSSGKIHVPGTLDMWKDLFIHHPHGKYDGKLTKAAAGWNSPDDLLDALFALSRKAVDNEPLKIFMALSDVDRERQTPLLPETAGRLAREYRKMGAQYSMFAEVPTLSDKTILSFIDTASNVGVTRDAMLRTDAVGTFQALTSLWQIFVRQGSIPLETADGSLPELLNLFGNVKNARDVFDAGRNGVGILLKASHSPAGMSPQDRLMDLAGGMTDSGDGEAQNQMRQEMGRVFEAQRLISIKTLFDLDDNLQGLTKGGKLNTQLVQRMASRIADIQLPRSAMSAIEKNTMSFGYYTDKHIDVQRKLNLRALIEKAANNPEKLHDLRGTLAPFLRDTLVGLVYIHYAPPGAQILLTNPLFVRSHDFIGVQGVPQTWRTTEVFGSGWPSSAGGRLVGSLSGLSYALAEAEQNFLIPSRQQALIWGDLVPQMLQSATVPRWWNVTGDQMHWVGLHVRLAESAIAESSLQPELRKTLLADFTRQAPPARVYRVASALERGDVGGALDYITPSELFVIARNLLEENKESGDPIASEIRTLERLHPERINYRSIGRAFGTPKPTLTNSYEPGLLNLRTFPALMGFSSRVMAESWESNLIYYAALADEMHLSPQQLNLMVPTWTQQTVERIFATHLEDWPALLRSLRGVGNEVRQRGSKPAAAEKAAL